MYTRPIIFKIYSIIMFLLSIAFPVILLWQVLSGAGSSLAEGSPLSGASISVGAIVVISVVFSCVLLLVAYAEFTSMFTFANMIEHEKLGDRLPFKKSGIVASPRFYSAFGTVLFIITFIMSIGSFIYNTIVLILALSAGIISVWRFILLMLLYIVLCAVYIVIGYIRYYCQYRTFATLLDLKRSVSPTDGVIQSLGKINPNYLRAFCVALYVFGLVLIAISLLSILFIGGAGLVLTIFAVILFIPMGIIGCFTDNLAMMQEHYMIKYKLI